MEEDLFQTSRGFNPRFRHYKTGQAYTWLLECRDAHGTTLVVYCKAGDSKIWARPKAMFEGMVEKDGHRVRRFQPLPANEAQV